MANGGQICRQQPVDIDTTYMPQGYSYLQNGASTFSKFYAYTPEADHLLVNYDRGDLSNSLPLIMQHPYNSNPSVGKKLASFFRGTFKRGSRIDHEVEQMKMLPENKLVFRHNASTNNTIVDYKEGIKQYGSYTKSKPVLTVHRKYQGDKIGSSSESLKPLKHLEYSHHHSRKPGIKTPPRRSISRSSNLTMSSESQRPSVLISPSKFARCSNRRTSFSFHPSTAHAPKSLLKFSDYNENISNGKSHDNSSLSSANQKQLYSSSLYINIARPLNSESRAQRVSIEQDERTFETSPIGVSPKERRLSGDYQLFFDNAKNKTVPCDSMNNFENNLSENERMTYIAHDGDVNEDTMSPSDDEDVQDVLETMKMVEESFKANQPFDPYTEEEADDDEYQATEIVVIDNDAQKIENMKACEDYQLGVTVETGKDYQKEEVTKEEIKLNEVKYDKRIIDKVCFASVQKTWHASIVFNENKIPFYQIDALSTSSFDHIENIEPHLYVSGCQNNAHISTIHGSYDSLVHRQQALVNYSNSPCYVSSFDFDAKNREFIYPSNNVDDCGINVDLLPHTVLQSTGEEESRCLPRIRSYRRHAKSLCEKLETRCLDVSTGKRVQSVPELPRTDYTNWTKDFPDLATTIWRDIGKSLKDIGKMVCETTTSECGTLASTTLISATDKDRLGNSVEDKSILTEMSMSLGLDWEQKKKTFRDVANSPIPLVTDTSNANVQVAKQCGRSLAVDAVCAIYPVKSPPHSHLKKDSPVTPISQTPIFQTTSWQTVLIPVNNQTNIETLQSLQLALIPPIRTPPGPTLCSRCSHDVTEISKPQLRDKMCQTTFVMPKTEKVLITTEEVIQKNLGFDKRSDHLGLSGDETTSDILPNDCHANSEASIKRSLTDEDSEVTHSLLSSSPSTSDYNISFGANFQAPITVTHKRKDSPCEIVKSVKSDVHLKPSIRARSSEQRRRRPSVSKEEEALSWEEMINKLYTKSSMSQPRLKLLKRGSSAPAAQHRTNAQASRLASSLPASRSTNRPHSKLSRENFLCHTFASLQKVREKANEPKIVPPPNKRIRWVH